MKKIRVLNILTVLLIIFLSAYGVSSFLYEISAFESHVNNSTYHHIVHDVLHESHKAKIHHRDENSYYSSPDESIPFDNTMPTFEYLTFEEVLLEFATDVVVAQYVDSRSFGESLIEFEFIVVDRVLGDTADRIFVYAENNVNVRVVDVEREIYYSLGGLSFNSETYYLLPLIGISLSHANTHEDGFTFIRNAVIDLDNPSNSRIYNEPLSNHSETLYFDANLSKQDFRGIILSHIEEITRNNTPSRGFIRSKNIEDIVINSPYVLLIEISKPLRLSNEQESSDWMATDLYYVNVTQSLKGNVNTTQENAIIFPADMVSTGEVYIVAVEPIREGSSWYQFTSRNSLFSIDQLDDILGMLQSHKMVSYNLF